MLYFTSFKY